MVDTFQFFLYHFNFSWFNFWTGLLPHRIEALGCVMALCLLVYTLGERCLRQSLQQAGKTVANQLGKGT
ncbi:MAG: hypothetical protein VKJ64_10160 [Leptolyngbyaceae bacterium]|nr:hypothetical protein [Leptolyngbyaceae bacterium]